MRPLRAEPRAKLPANGRPALLSVLLGVWLIACATTSTGLAPPLATLELRNSTDTAYDIVVRGRVEGRAPSGVRTRFRDLLPGKVLLRAEPVGVGGRGFERELELVPDEVTPWVLAIPGLERPMPPPLADLVVENPTARDLDIYLDRARLGTVLAGDTRRFRDLPAGSHRVEASGAVKDRNLQADIDLPEDGEASWRPEAPVATLTVINDGLESFAITVDGEEIGVVKPGENLRLDDRPEGPHDLVAVGALSEHRLSREIQLRADFPAEWRLTASSANATITNDTDESLLLKAPAPADTELGPDESLDIPALPSGRVVLSARGKDSGLFYRAEAELRPGQRYLWHVREQEGSLRVENRSGRELDIYVDRVRRGEVAPGSAVNVSDVPSETFSATAYEERSRQTFEAAIEVDGTKTAVWTVRSELGALRVENMRPEAVAVYVDSAMVGRAESGADITFTGLHVGRRRVEAVGATTGEVVRRTVIIETEHPSRMVLSSPRGFIEITNETDDVLLAMGVLTSQQGRIEPGTTARYVLPTGTHRIGVRGARSKIPYRKRVKVDSDQVAEWRIARAVGYLLVLNELDEAAQITVDGQDRGRVEAGATLSLTSVPAGVRKLKAEGARTLAVYHAEVGIAPDNTATWRVATTPPTLVVANQSAEGIHVAIDGRPWGYVETGGQKNFRGLIRGVHGVRVVGARTAAPQSYKVDLESGQREALTVLPPRGGVVIDNRSGDDLEVRVDGEVIGRVPAGAAPTPLSAPGGNRTVEAFHTRSGKLSSFRLNIHPGVIIRVPVYRQAARLAVANHTTVSVRLNVDDHDYGLLEPGKSMIAEDLDVGTVLLRAEHPDSKRQWVERRELEPGATATWVLRE